MTAAALMTRGGIPGNDRRPGHTAALTSADGAAHRCADHRSMPIGGDARAVQLLEAGQRMSR